MPRSSRESLWSLGYIVCGGLAGWLNWLILPGRLQHRLTVNFIPFLIIGVAGGLIYAGARQRGLGFSIMMVILLFFLQLALTPPLSLASVTRAAIWAFPIGGAFLIASYVFRMLNRLRLGKFVFMAILVGLGYVVTAAIFRMRAEREITRQLVLRQFLLGFKSGGLLGVLIELLELCFSFNSPPGV